MAVHVNSKLQAVRWADLSGFLLDCGGISVATFESNALVYLEAQAVVIHDAVRAAYLSASSLIETAVSYCNSHGIDSSLVVSASHLCV